MSQQGPANSIGPISRASEFDALADLFLDASPRARSVEMLRPATIGTPVFGASGGAPAGSGGTASHAGAGVHASIGAGGRPGVVRATGTDMGGPALRLTREAERPATRTERDGRAAETDSTGDGGHAEHATRLCVEGLVVGHLPVLGSAWITQYAKHVAEARREAVALLRMQEGQTWLDVVMPRSLQARTHSRVGPAAADPEQCTLDQAIGRAAREARVWLVRVDETAEPDLPSIPGLASITLLTGADDAAVVASYRTIKNLRRVVACPRDDGRGDAEDGGAPGEPADGLGEDDEGGPQRGLALRLAIMGADDAKAADAEAKLRRAAETFLGESLAPAAKVAKIGGSSTIALYRGTSTMPVREVIGLARAERSPEGARREAVPHADARTAPAAADRAGPATSADISGDVVHAIGLGVSSPLDHMSRGVVEVTGAPIPNGAIGPTPTETADLASLIAGLRPLGVQCPYATNVQIATGEDGALHLLVRAAGGQGRGGDRVQELLAAASWAEDHRDLLARVHPDLARAAGEAGPHLHLLTEDARHVRGLIDTAIRLHVLCHVGVNGRAITVAKAIN